MTPWILIILSAVSIGCANDDLDPCELQCEHHMITECQIDNPKCLEWCKVQRAHSKACAQIHNARLRCLNNMENCQWLHECLEHVRNKYSQIICPYP
jgi:hypothetical protein